MGSVWYWSPLMLITPTWSGQYVPQIFKWGESPIAPTHVPPHFSLIWPGYSQKSLNEECLILVPTLARYVSFEPLTTLVRDTLTWPVFRMHIILSLHNFFFFFYWHFHLSAGGLPHLPYHCFTVYILCPVWWCLCGQGLFYEVTSCHCSSHLASWPAKLALSNPCT